MLLLCLPKLREREYFKPDPIATETLGANPAETTNYSYDDLNRLTGISRPNGENISYIYDTRGNRTQTTGATITDESFIAGEFDFNGWGELESFTNSATSETYSYEYDAEGLRSKKISPDGAMQYHLDNSGRVIAEYSGSGVTAQNIWGHKILARKIGDNYYYYLYNGHGDVVQIVNEAGSIVNTYKYDEWGNLLAIFKDPALGIDNPIRYAGEYFDEESGSYYLRARYYDPLIARFISKDSYEGYVANPLSINQYTYCYNNPLLYVDPTGHWADQASLQEMYESGEIDNYHITYVPGVGETITVTQGGATLNISDNTANEYFDYTERVHDLMGFGNTRPADEGSSDPGSSGGSSVYKDNLAANAKPTTADQEVTQVIQIIVQN